MEAIPLARSPELGSVSTTEELLRTGYIPGRSGVILDQRVVSYEDIWRLTEQHGIEFALYRQDGKFVLASGSRVSVEIPEGVRPISHSHALDEFGLNSPVPSIADINLLNRYWISNPAAPRPVSTLIANGETSAVRFGATGLEVIQNSQ